MNEDADDSVTMFFNHIASAMIIAKAIINQLSRVTRITTFQESGVNVEPTCVRCHGTYTN